MEIPKPNTITNYLLNMIYILISTFISEKVSDYLHIPFGISFMLYNFGSYHTKLFLNLFLFNISLILLLNKSKFRTYLLLAINLGFFGYLKQNPTRFNVDVTSKNNISIQFMLLVPKMYYCAQEIIDLRYIFYLPGLMAGPIVPLKVFFKKENCKKTFFWKKILETIFYGLLNLSLKFINLDYFTTNNTLNNIFFLFLFGLTFRCQYYFVWSFSAACYSLCNLNVINIEPINFELSESVQDVMRNWNIYVSIWLKESIFKQIKVNYFFAGFFTCLISSMWHGFYLSYFMMFLSFSICVLPLKSISFYTSKYRIGRIYNVITTSLLVSFFSVPFYFLEVEKTFLVWKNVNFYGFFYIGIAFLVFFVETLIKKIKKE